MIFTDTHTHLYSEEFSEDRDLMLQRAFDAGVSRLFVPAIDSSYTQKMYDLEAQYPENVFLMMGLHPCYVKEDFEKELTIVEDWLNKYKFIAIGEIGMDLYWDKTFVKQQEEAFLYQCQLAKKHNLWIDIHSRNAFWETINLIEKNADPNLKGIFHCFTGTLEEAQKAIELGFLLGIGGVATFKNGGLDKILPHVDLSSIVLETDAPYLAPVPYRGKRNEPAYLTIIAQRVADLMECSVEKVIEQSTQNALNLCQ